MLREVKEDKERVTQELNKLKKTLRFTKLNESEIERQAVVEENRRQAKVNQQLQVELEAKLSQQNDMEMLSKEMKAQAAEIRDLTRDNIKYEEILEEIEMHNKQLTEKLLVQEQKYRRSLDVHNRKNEQLARYNQRLKEELSILQDQLQTIKKKQAHQQPTQRPATSHPHSRPEGVTVSEREKQAALIYNEQLRKDLQAAKQQLIESESRLRKHSARPSVLSQDQEIEFELTKNDTDGFRQMQ